MLIALNSTEYQSISLSAWMAANPQALLATNFRVAPETFKDFPKEQRCMPG